MSAALEMYIEQGQWEKAIETAAGQVSSRFILKIFL